MRPVSLGAEGWVHRKLGCPGHPSAKVHVVYWRYDRVRSGVRGSNLSLTQTVALAKLQQRRIVAALGP